MNLKKITALMIGAVMAVSMAAPAMGYRAIRICLEQPDIRITTSGLWLQSLI